MYICSTTPHHQPSKDSIHKEVVDMYLYVQHLVTPFTKAHIHSIRKEGYKFNFVQTRKALAFLYIENLNDIGLI